MEKKIFSLLLVSIVLVACNSNRTGNSDDESVQTVNMVTDPEYYDLVMGQATDTNFVILKEADDAMFSMLDKVVKHNGNYYIIDMFDARTVLGFDRYGNPMAKYGSVGQGPGEYMRPSDIFVDDESVYVLANSNKIIRFAPDGTFIAEKSLPFSAKAALKLSDGRFMHNIFADGQGGVAVCVTDSTMTPVQQLLNYANGYVGGSTINNIFRQYADAAEFYLSLSDSMYLFDNNGDKTNTIVFDFGDKSLPESAKLDWISFRNNNPSASYFKFADSPMRVRENLWVAWVEGDDADYTFVFDPVANRSGALKHGKGQNSVFDIMLPLALGDGEVISLLTDELMDFYTDYNQLPDSVKSSIEAGNRVLMITEFKR